MMKNEDQKIQTPFKSENYIGEEYLGDFEEIDEDISNLGDNNKSPYLSRQDYEASLSKESTSKEQVSNNMTDDFTYQNVADDIIVELQRKYNLRPRNKNLPNVPTKNILPRNDTNEVNPKVADKKSAKINTIDNPVQLEPVGTTPVNTQAPIKENKVTSQCKTEKKRYRSPKH